jgi:hypothetical protein
MAGHRRATDTGTGLHYPTASHGLSGTGCGPINDSNAAPIFSRPARHSSHFNLPVNATASQQVLQIRPMSGRSHCRRDASTRHGSCDVGPQELSGRAGDEEWSSIRSDVDRSQAIPSVLVKAAFEFDSARGTAARYDKNMIGATGTANQGSASTNSRRGAKRHEGDGPGRYFLGGAPVRPIYDQSSCPST